MSDKYFDIALERTKQLRGQMTNREFEKKTGIGKSTQDSWERKNFGLRNIGMHSAISIAKSFGVSLDWLFGLTDIKETHIQVDDNKEDDANEDDTKKDDTQDNNLEQMNCEIKVPNNFDSDGYISIENYLKLLHILVRDLCFNVSTMQDGSVNLSNTNKHLYRFFEDTKDIYMVSDLSSLISQHYNNDNYIIYHNKLMTKIDQELYNKRMAYINADLECDGDESMAYYSYCGEAISKEIYNSMIMEREEEFDQMYGRLQL